MQKPGQIHFFSNVELFQVHRARFRSDGAPRSSSAAPLEADPSFDRRQKLVIERFDQKNQSHHGKERFGGNKVILTCTDLGFFLGVRRPLSGLPRSLLLLLGAEQAFPRSFKAGDDLFPMISFCLRQNSSIFWSSWAGASGPVSLRQSLLQAAAPLEDRNSVVGECRSER